MADNEVKIASLIVLFAYMIVLFIVSSMPDKAGSENILSDLPSLLQNLLHIPAFGILTLLWIRVLKDYRVRYWLAVMVAAGISMLYGAGLELYQASVPGRTSSMIDIMLNFSGVFLSAFIYDIINKRNIFGAFKW